MQLDIIQKVKKGNKKKIAEFVSNKLKIEALDVSNDLNDCCDQLILINAMYTADIDVEVKDFLKNNSDKIKSLININSSASGKSTYKAVKKVCDKYGISISDKEFHTVASWIFINKGRPNEEDFNRLNLFLEEIFNKD